MHKRVNWVDPKVFKDQTKYIFKIDEIEYFPKTNKEMYEWYLGGEFIPFNELDEITQYCMLQYIWVLRKATEEDFNIKIELPFVAKPIRKYI